MKANELMIGDWVGRVFDDKRIIEDYRQVDWIETGAIGMRYRKVWSIRCIEPIPLTAEILEKNGFVKHKDTWCRGEATIDDITYSIDGDVRMKGCLLPIAITTVHELQHALRLCGLNELADNLKI